MSICNLDIQLAPGESLSSTTYKARIIGDYILDEVAHHKASDVSTPLMVAMQGPQGCGRSRLFLSKPGPVHLKPILRTGKTTLTNEIQRYLYASRVKARSAVLSLDGKLILASWSWHRDLVSRLIFWVTVGDLYLTKRELQELAVRHPWNRLLSGRGLPGTHDLGLAATLLDDVVRCNMGTTPTLQLPLFDKSAFGGEGDRSPHTVAVDTPVDVFILEGWSMGFEPLSTQELFRRYELACQSALAEDQSDFSLLPSILSHSLESLTQVNEYLVAASKTLYSPFSLMIQIRPASYAHVYAWRIQQEKALVAQGRGGMDDEQVRHFVARYMPGYELWGGQVQGKGLWEGKRLVLSIGADREVVSVERA